MATAWPPSVFSARYTVPVAPRASWSPIRYLPAITCPFIWSPLYPARRGCCPGACSIRSPDCLPGGEGPRSARRRFDGQVDRAPQLRGGRLVVRRVLAEAVDRELAALDLPGPRLAGAELVGGADDLPQVALGLHQRQAGLLRQVLAVDLAGQPGRHHRLLPRPHDRAVVAVAAEHAAQPAVGRERRVRDHHAERRPQP